MSIEMNRPTATKIFRDIPFAHRLARHQGHCRFVHGHNWTIEVTFQADRLDENGFVVDFGDLGWIKSWIATKLDHCLVIAADDPYLELFTEHDKQLWHLTIVPAGSTEALAEWIRLTLDTAAQQIYRERDVRIFAVELRESESNSAMAVIIPDAKEIPA
jgi:6-pyruvoyltetrahydropterin/6-carboxytetrahydropterin synthase